MKKKLVNDLKERVCRKKNKGFGSNEELMVCLYVFDL